MTIRTSLPPQRAHPSSGLPLIRIAQNDYVINSCRNSLMNRRPHAHSEYSERLLAPRGAQYLHARGMSPLAQSLPQKVQTGLEDIVPERLRLSQQYLDRKQA